jgi:hypothetical protein
MVITAGLLKPDKASVGVTSPVKAREDKTRRPTISTDIQPPTKRTKAVSTMTDKITRESMDYSQKNCGFEKIKVSRL